MSAFHWGIVAGACVATNAVLGWYAADHPWLWFLVAVVFVMAFLAGAAGGRAAARAER